MLRFSSRQKARSARGSRKATVHPRLESLEDRSMPSFGVGGVVLTDFNNSFDFAADVALRPDGQIVVSGRTNNTFAVARYDAAGNLDPSFDGDGRVAGPAGFGVDRGAGALALQ